MITAFRLSVGSVGWGSGVGASEETGDGACEEGSRRTSRSGRLGRRRSSAGHFLAFLRLSGLTMVTFGFVSSMYTLSAVSARESRGLVVVSTWTVVPAKAGVVFSVEEAARLPWNFLLKKGPIRGPN